MDFRQINFPEWSILPIFAKSSVAGGAAPARRSHADCCVWLRCRTRQRCDWRNRRYDRVPAAVEHASVPVISVGNLTLGGTGKTPMVKWLAQWFSGRGLRVAIVSRGYGAAAGKQNDEALELAQALPNVPHVQNPDRVAGARAAIDEFDSQLILLDDGFQHRRLARDLDIVLLDATEPFGFDHVFPRGTLREPVTGLRRAGVVCLSRSDLLDSSGRDLIRGRVAKLAPDAVWCEAAHAPQGLLNSAGGIEPLTTLRGRRVAAFCGIGNPAAFRHAVAQAGCDIVSWREFPDHHAYGEADQEELSRVSRGEQRRDCGLHSQGSW